MSEPISATNFVANYVVSFKLGEVRAKEELTRLFGQQVKCNKCGATSLAKEAWMMRRNNDLVCPKCSEVWVMMAFR